MGSPMWVRIWTMGSGSVMIALESHAQTHFRPGLNHAYLVLHTVVEGQHWDYRSVPAGQIRSGSGT